MEAGAALLGPFVDEDGARELYPSVRLVESDSLMLVTRSGRAVWPMFQFEGGEVLPGLAEVVDVLPEGLVSRWTVASWLLAPRLRRRR